MPVTSIERRIASLEEEGVRGSKNLQVLFVSASATAQEAAEIQARAEALKAAGAEVIVLQFVSKTPGRYASTEENCDEVVS